MSAKRKRWALCVVAAALAAAAAALVYFRPGNGCVRGAWITGYGTGHLTPGQVDRTIAAAKAAKLNTLFIEVRRSADAYYRNGLEPVASGVQPGFDPLAYTLKRAHAQGIKVHAWVSVFRIWRGRSRPTDATHLANQHPEWLTLSDQDSVAAADGVFVDPANPAAVDHIVRVIADIVRRYDIDGLHLDFIRYPDAKWGYSAVALRRYLGETGAAAKPKPGDALWQKWRRTQVTNAVRAVRHETRGLKPKLLMSVAGIAYGECPESFTDTAAYNALGQDWQIWLADDLIDATAPMIYRDMRRPEQREQFRRWLPALRKWSLGKPVLAGLAAYVNDAESLTEQIEEARRSRLDGFVVFCFNESGIRVNGSRHDLAQALAKTDSRWANPLVRGRRR